MKKKISVFSVSPL